MTDGIIFFLAVAFWLSVLYFPEIRSWLKRRGKTKPEAPAESDAYKSIMVLKETGCLVLDAPAWFAQLSEEQKVQYADRYWYEGRV